MKTKRERWKTGKEDFATQVGVSFGTWERWDSVLEAVGWCWDGVYSKRKLNNVLLANKGRAKMERWASNKD